MKKRKTFVGMALFIAVLVLGVGYASVADIPLNLTGTANVKANADFSVEYDTDHVVTVTPTDAKIDWDDDDTPEQAVVTGSYTNGANATMTVYLDNENRTASAIYKVDNNSPELNATIGAEISTDFDTENAKYLSVTKELYSDETCNTVLGDTQLAPGESAYLKVTVTLDKVPAIDVEDATFNITLTAKAADQA